MADTRVQRYRSVSVGNLADSLIELIERCNEPPLDAEESEYDMRRSKTSIVQDFLYDLKEFINEP